MRPTHLNLHITMQYFRVNFFILFLFSALLLLQSCTKEIEIPDDASAQDAALLSKKDDDKNKQVDMKLIADGFVSPVGVVSPGENDKRLFVIDQIGKIWVLDRDGNKLPIPFLDITSKLVALNPGFDERGLLGLAFHPKYKHNGKFYVYYSAPRRAGGPSPTTLWNNLTRVSEFKVSANENVADINSERFILEIDDPQGNHNAGTIVFGPKDGYLYIAIGDGGGANDTPVGHVPDWYLPNAGGNGQDIEANLFGNILRIDIDNGVPYSIPVSNPFVNKPGLDEIYAYGLRNPYRFSIDSKGNHDIIAGDVGQRLYEEINVIKKGANYGWNVKEGFICFNAANSLVPFPNCPMMDNFGNPLVDPVLVINTFSNPAGGRATAIVGGHVYRGNDLDGYEGKYIFGTFTQSPTTTNGELFAAKMRNSGTWTYEKISLKSSPNDIGALLKGMGEDRKGELYLTTSLIVGPTGTTGKVYKLVEADDDDDDDDDE
jgi:glucose/arabinose dehydrogenase